MTLKTNQPLAVARFWRDLLDYQVAPNHSESVMLVGGADEPVLLIQPSVHPVEPGAIHLDLRPENQGECVARALRLGAKAAYVGQIGDEGWVVLADPGGLNFCVLASETEHRARLTADPGSPTPVE